MAMYDEEREALLPSSNHGQAKATKNHAKPTSLAVQIKEHLNANVDTKYGYLVLIAMFFVGGLIDSAAYNAYNCFVSMQTGNTVFAALGVSDLPVSAPALQWTKSVTSIVSFLLGSLFISSIHHYFGARKRWVLSFSFGLQLVITAIASYLVASGNSSDSPVKKPSNILALPKDPGFPWMDLVPIALLSFQAAGKVVASRVLDFPALPTVVLTTMFCDLMSDPRLFTAGLFGDAPRNRKIGGAVFYFVGAVSGGAAARSTIGLAGALWIGSAIKGVCVLLWLVWKADENESDDSV